MVRGAVAAVAVGQDVAAVAVVVGPVQSVVLVISGICITIISQATTLKSSVMAEPAAFFVTRRFIC